MSMILVNGENKTDEIKNKKVIALGLKAIGVVTGGHLLLNLKKATITCTLRRAGRDFTLFNDSLLPFVVESAFSNAMWDYIINGDQFTLSANRYMIPMLIDFRTLIDLQGADILEVNIKLNDGFFVASAGTLDANSCRLQLDEVEGMGEEIKTPYIHTKSVQAGESRYTNSFGDNIESIFLLDNTQMANDELNKVINQFNLTAENYNVKDNFEELYFKRLVTFPTLAAAKLRGQCFMLYAGEDLDKVNVDIALDSEGVTANRLIFVVRSFYTDERLITKAAHEAVSSFNTGVNKYL